MNILLVFIKKKCEVIESDTCNFVNKMWSNLDVFVEINQTNIILIPKVPHPEFINYLCPIFLCNNFYKIISKMVVNRLKIMIPQIVSLVQTDFVIGKNMHAKDERENGMFFYYIVNLTKAYDMRKWYFIEIY